MSEKNYLYFDDGKVEMTNQSLEKVQKKLDPGFYSVTSLVTQSGIIHKIKKFNYEEIGNFTTNNYNKISNYIEKFLSKTSNLEKLNYKTSMGVMFHGLPGGGKTTLTYQKCKDLVENKNACVFVPTDMDSFIYFWEVVKNVRESQDNLICVIYDECEQLMNEYESLMKRRLDGSETVNNLITFACTNYINDIPSSIIDRSSRFRYVIEFNGIENEEQIKKILLNSIPNYSSEKIERFIVQFKNSTLDQIKNGIMDIILEVDDPSPVKRSIGFHKKSNNISKPIKLKSTDFKDRSEDLY